jgi:hypothetical protein
MGPGSFPEVRRPRRGVDHPPSPSAEVKEKVEPYLYSLSGLMWPVLGGNLLLIYTYLCTLTLTHSYTHTHSHTHTHTHTHTHSLNVFSSTVGSMEHEDCKTTVFGNIHGIIIMIIIIIKHNNI